MQYEGKERREAKGGQQCKPFAFYIAFSFSGSQIFGRN
jgi:hypothetical protein